MKFNYGDRVKHIRTGKSYVIIDIGTVKINDYWTDCYVYYSNDKAYVRTKEDMEEKFEVVK